MKYMNNLSHKKTYINSSYITNNLYYTIKKNNWKNSFDIEFNTNINDLHILNLYLILKSYLYNSKIIIKNMFIYSIDSNNKNNIILLKQLDINILYKINFLDFVSLIYNINIYENNYINNINISGIRINSYMFFSENLLEPIFPWSSEWLNYIGVVHTL